jgi:putative hydroxymethylpyrimidine transport system permease protein
MMLTLDATRWTIFGRVEFPSALPSIFSGLRVAAAYAAVGAVFGEWAGSTSGLGYVMLQSAPELDTARIFAAVVILSAISLGLFGLVSAVERLVAPWAREEAPRAA